MTYDERVDLFARFWNADELRSFCMMFERLAQTTKLTSYALGVYHVALTALGRVEAEAISPAAVAASPKLR